MVKLQLIVGLYALVMGLQALNQAVPYELLYFYSVYKMEYRVFPEDSRTIATECKHTPNLSPAGKEFEKEAAEAGVLGICTFDEFVKEVGSKSSLGKLTWSNDGRSLVPDPDKMASRIIALGSKKPLLYWPSKLLPKAGFPTGEGSSIVQVPLPDLLQGILDAAQNARRAASMLSPTPDFVNSCLKDAQNFLRIGNQFRLSDQTRFFNKKYLSDLPEGDPFSKLFEEKPQVITKADEVTPITDSEFPLSNYNVIDWDKTWLASQSSTTPEQRDALLKVVEAYGRSTATKEDAAAKIHQDVIDMQAFSISLIKSDDLECRSPKKPEITLMEKRKLMYLVRRHGF